MSFTAGATPKAHDTAAVAAKQQRERDAPDAQHKPDSLHAQPWLQPIVGAPGARLVFDSHGTDPAATSLSTDLSADHLVGRHLDDARAWGRWSS